MSIFLATLVFSFAGSGFNTGVVPFELPENENILQSDREIFLSDQHKFICQKNAWQGQPQLSGGVLKAVMETECTLTGNHGGSFSQLDQYLRARIVKEARKIYKGPIDEVYQGMPSVFYDADVMVVTANNRVLIRQDGHLATDGFQTLVFDTFSKKITAGGTAKYLRKTDVRMKILGGKTVQEFIAVLGTTVLVEQPWYAPAGMFMSEMKSMISTNFEKAKKQVLVELIDNL